MKMFIIAMAAAVAVAPAVAQARDWGVFSAVTLASDYRYQGASESRGHPALQGYAHWQRADGVYAGIFATQIDFGYAGAPTYEIDAYAGRNFSFDAGRSELKLEGMSTTYPDNHTPGPTLDFVQAKIQAKHVAGPWTTIGLVTYVPEGSYRSGPALRVESEADYSVSRSLSMKAALGSQGGGRGHDRTYWSLGGVYSWKTVAFDVRYVGNDRSRSNCGFQPKACDAAIVGTVTVSLPPLL